MGDLILDVITRLPGSMHTIYRGTDTLTQMETHPGGAGANTAIWLSRLGAAVSFISRVGDDTLGDALIANLEKEKISPYVARDKKRPTGTLVSLVESDGERSMLIGPAAHFFLDAPDVPEKIFLRADALYLSGYLFYRDTPRLAALRAIGLARANQAQIAVDPASVSLIEALGTQRLLKWINEVDILLPNLEEARLLAKTIAPKNARQADRVLQTLLKKFPIIGLKLGADGSLCGSRNQSTSKMKEMCAIPAKAIGSLVDSTGCGDAWNAAFLFHSLSGATLDKAANQANALAAWVLQHAGATPPKK